MYKNLEVLDKTKFKSMKFTQVEVKEVAKNIGIVPLGYDEVLDMAYFCPVIIMGEVAPEFVAFTGISNEKTIYNEDNILIPTFCHTYPFANMVLKNEKNELVSVIGINNDAKVSKKGKHFIFNKKDELQKIAQDKIDQIRTLNKKREVSKNIIQTFKKYDLLKKQSFKVVINEEETTILDNFYIVDRDKLKVLEDKVLATFAKNGLMSIVDCHLKSLGNFKKLLTIK
jgi:hypothetical protein